VKNLFSLLAYLFIPYVFFHFQFIFLIIKQFINEVFAKFLNLILIPSFFSAYHFRNNLNLTYYYFHDEFLGIKILNPYFLVLQYPTSMLSRHHFYECSLFQNVHFPLSLYFFCFYY